MKRRLIILNAATWIYAAGAVIVLLGAVPFSCRRSGKGGRKHLKTLRSAEQIGRGYWYFQQEFGCLPSGTDSEVFAQLIGDNPKRIAFIEHSDESEPGVDAWGTQMRLLRGESCVGVWSAGNDCRFESDPSEGDDIVRVSSAEDAQ